MFDCDWEFEFGRESSIGPDDVGWEDAIAD